MNILYIGEIIKKNPGACFVDYIIATSEENCDMLLSKIMERHSFLNQFRSIQQRINFHYMKNATSSLRAIFTKGMRMVAVTDAYPHNCENILNILKEKKYLVFEFYIDKIMELRPFGNYQYHICDNPACKKAFVWHSNNCLEVKDIHYFGRDEDCVSRLCETCTKNTNYTNFYQEIFCNLLPQSSLL